MAETFNGFVAGGGGFMWLTSSGRPCKQPIGGCAGRNEQIRTLEEWVAAGLPRTGWSACQGRCHCLLIPMLRFGIGITPELDPSGTRGFDAGAVDEPAPAGPASRASGQPFAGVEGWTAELFIGELESLPVVGVLADEVRELARRVRAGEVSVGDAAKLLDVLLGLDSDGSA